MMRMVLLPMIVMTLAGCATSPTRPARSSYSCMAAVRADLPTEISDKHAHCLAAGGIAQRCSVTEARIAGLGKEFQDLFTRDGDPSWADWRSDKAGIACAKRSGSDATELAACCQALK